MNIRSVEFRQLAMLGILSSVLSFVFSGLEVLYTLYAINVIEVSASEWSQIRGYRYMLTIVIVLVLGTYAGKVGHKKTAAITIAIMLCNLLLFVIQPTKLFLFITLPIHAAFISMITMSINVLVQEVPNRLQALSNTVYRSTYTGLAIFGPLTLALFAKELQISWFVFFVICLVLCLPFLLSYPSHVSSNGDMKVLTFRNLLLEWRLLITNKRFMLFELWVTMVYSAFLVNVIFGPIKLIQVIGMNDQQFSYTSTGVAIVTMSLTIMMGFFLRRMLLQLVYFPLFICSLGNTLLGLQSSVIISVVLFMATNALNALSFASVSMWTSRMVTKEQLGFAFTMHKVLIGLFGLLFSITLAYMETVIGIDQCMIFMGIVGCIFSVLLRREMKVQLRRMES